MGNNVSQQIEKRKTRRAQSLTAAPQKPPQRFATLIASVGLSKRSPQPSSVPATPPPPTRATVPEPQAEPEQEPEPPVSPQTEKENRPESEPEASLIWASSTAVNHLSFNLPSIHHSFDRATTIRTLTPKQRSCQLNPPPFLVRYVL
jgi:hypothetical protein